MPVAFQRVGHPLQCLAITPQQGQKSPLGGKGTGDLGANAACGTRDECMAASQ